jgi:hypothetical protein
MNSTPAVSKTRRTAKLFAVVRARPTRNALRHGLGLSVHTDPALSEDVETLAREIAGPGASAEMKEDEVRNLSHNLSRAGGPESG